MEKVAKNGRKVKAIALLFCCFLPIYEKWKKSLKMDEMFFLPSYEKWKKLLKRDKKLRL
jgi:hypothetical protein